MNLDGIDSYEDENDDSYKDDKITTISIIIIIINDNHTRLVLNNSLIYPSVFMYLSMRMHTRINIYIFTHAFICKCECFVVYVTSYLEHLQGIGQWAAGRFFSSGYAVSLSL